MKEYDRSKVFPEYESLYPDRESAEDALRRLIDIVRILRHQCPWDKEQTHQSLRACLIEEAYETVEAINNGDYDNLEEELGDVLLQVVFHGQLAEEAEKSTLVAIINRECDKMIRRHPHIFLKETAKSVDKALEKWENVKRSEKKVHNTTSILQSVPKALPALIRSFKVQKKAADVGFDWDDVSDAFQKIKEETEELLEVQDQSSQERKLEELGDLLFSVVNVARFLGLDPEEALNFTTEKFIRRFSYVESQALKADRRLEDMSLSEMDALWDEAKDLERD